MPPHKACEDEKRGDIESTRMVPGTGCDSMKSRVKSHPLGPSVYGCVSHLPLLKDSVCPFCTQHCRSGGDCGTKGIVNSWMGPGRLATPSKWVGGISPIQSLKSEERRAWVSVAHDCLHRASVRRSLMSRLFRGSLCSRDTAPLSPSKASTSWSPLLQGS